MCSLFMMKMVSGDDRTTRGQCGTAGPGPGPVRDRGLVFFKSVIFQMIILKYILIFCL